MKLPPAYFDSPSAIIQMFYPFEEDYYSEYDRDINLFQNAFEDIIELAPSYSLRRENTEREIINLKEIKSDNNNFMQENKHKI